MKKLLITGASGFVGSYFINKYKEKYEIKAFSFLKDNINTLDCSGVDLISPPACKTEAILTQSSGDTETY